MRKIFIIVAIVIGILLALQVRSFKKVEYLIQRSEPKNAFAELRLFQIANEKLRENIVQEEQDLAEKKSAISNAGIEDEIEKLNLLSGLVAVTGEGVEIIISGAVQEFWISDMVAQLVNIGAEAISINGARLTLRTAGFRSIAGGVVMRSRFLRPPLVITVIGPKKEMHRVMAQKGGIIDRMQKAHPQMAISLGQKDKIIIPALPQ